MNSSSLKNLFLINPEITYLNFGSFGACPQPVFNNYQDWQRLLESEPCSFIAREGVKYLQESRAALGAYLSCNSDDLVFVTNPTYAMNIIAKSLKLEPGDEILATDIEYGAMDRTWNYYCEQRGAVYVRQHIPLPITDKQTILDNFWKGYSSKTKAIFISQITSSTALILPVKEICETAKQRGLLTIIDGAHVPGHIPLDLSTLQADIYTGACHKWMMTPKGCSFLYVKRELQSQFDPVIISWGYKSSAPSHSQFLDYHQMQGTRDFSAFLTIKAALDFRNAHNWDEVSKTARDSVRSNCERFCNLLGTRPICPVTEEFLGQMCSIPTATEEPEKLQKLLFEKYKIEVPVMRQERDVYLRYSLNGFNTQGDLDTLYDALVDIMATTSLIKR
jgi:isopenicillin-N epimerase